MVNKRIAQYNSYVQEIGNRKNELEKELSRFDKQTADLLHFLEFEKCDAVKMMKITKKLKLIRQERRCVKEELQVVCQIYERTKKPVGFTSKAGNEKYNTSVVKEFKN